MRRCCTPSTCSQHDGEDLRGVALIERKQRLGRLLGRTGDAIQFVEHLAHDGANRVRPRLPDESGGHRVEAGGCALSRRAVEGLAQVEEPGERAVRREREEEWGKTRRRVPTRGN